MKEYYTRKNPPHTVVNGKKHCCKCKRELNISEFTENKKIKSGYNSWCKECVAENTQKFYAPHPKKTGYRTCTKCRQQKSLNHYAECYKVCFECQAERKASIQKVKEDKANLKIKKDSVKVCYKCKGEYPKTKEFFPKVEQHTYICRKCTNEARRNSESNKIRKKKYYEEHKEEICLKGKIYRDNRIKTGTFVEGTRDSLKKRCSSQRRHARNKGLPATFNHIQWEECREYFNNACAYCGKEDSLAQEHFIASANGGGYEKSNIVPSCMMCNSHKRDLDFFEWYHQQDFYNLEREQKILKYLGYEIKSISA